MKYKIYRSLVALVDIHSKANSNSLESHTLSNKGAHALDTS